MMAFPAVDPYTIQTYPNVYSIPDQKLVTHISSEPRLGGMEQNQSAFTDDFGGQIVSLRGSYPILEAARDKDWHMICLLLPGY